jgi:hypothetical protein
MRKRNLSSIVFLVACSCLFAQIKPTLVFDGVNGYPSGSKYRIEIFVAGDGMISDIKAYSEDSRDAVEVTHVEKKQNKITSVSVSEKSRNTFTFIIKPNKIQQQYIYFDIKNNKIFDQGTSTVLIAPRKGVLFETDERVFQKTKDYEFQIIDKATGDSLYKFKGNLVYNEGWYKADWKTVGNTTQVNEYVTMERYSDWVDAGSGTFTGDRFKSATLLDSVINFCILDAVYTNNETFIPFIFGLKTGTY